MDTPYQWTKQVASHWGGTRNGTIVHWPSHIEGKGEIRTQFHHVIDVAPTLLEAAGLPEPQSVNGVQQHPIEGVSMLYSFNDASAAERHRRSTSRCSATAASITTGGPPSRATGRRGFSLEKTPPFDDDVWELYDTTKDWSQAHDLSKQMPDKLHELQRLWLIEATRYNVLPLDDRVAERIDAGPSPAGRY